MKNARRTTPALTRWPAAAHGFTLIELLATMVIVATMSTVVIGLLSSISATYRKSADERRAAERAALALDRVVRLIREAPGKTGAAATPDIVTAGTADLELANGYRVSLDGTTLNLQTPLVKSAPLCVNVSAFALTYYGVDGQQLDFSAGATKDQVQRVYVRLAADGTELRATAMMRTTISQ